jgi:putative spermidine/putrescine transport system ATP-binding protein
MASAEHRTREVTLVDGGQDGSAAGLETAGGHTVDINGVTHRYGSFIAVDKVTLPVGAGEVVALLGPSGCGKTTLLRIVAGFVSQSEGTVMVDGRSIDDLPPNLRSVGIVFQSYALFPHMTVAENVAYGLRARGQRSEEVKSKVAHFLQMVQLNGMADRLPRQLSGGQQQRVALARALAVEPSVLLLDEPFSALDKSLRLDMQLELKRLQRQFGLTAILVTHDQDEAMSVADRVAVMNRGRVEQLDTPVGVYDAPATLFVSGFVGTTNQLPGRIASVSGAEARITLDVGADIVAAPTNAFAVGTRVIVTVRPEQLMLADAPGDGRWPVSPRLSIPMGANAVHEVEGQGGQTIKIIEQRRGAMAAAPATAWCAIRPDARPSVFATVESQS